MGWVGEGASSCGGGPPEMSCPASRFGARVVRGDVADGRRSTEHCPQGRVVSRAGFLEAQSVTEILVKVTFEGLHFR